MLHDVGFEVGKGEKVGIIGRNGAGKTTLLQILCGITRPTRGSFEVKGRIAPILALGSGFDGLLTGRENAMIGGAILGLEAPRGREAPSGDRRIRRYRHLLRPADAALFERHGGAPRLRHLRPCRRRHSDRRRGAVGRRRGCSRPNARPSSPISPRAAPYCRLARSRLPPDLCDRVIWIDEGAVRETGDPASVIARYREEMVAA